MRTFFCLRCSKKSISVEGLRCFHCENDDSQTVAAENFHLPAPKHGDVSSGYYVPAAKADNLESKEDFMLQEPNREARTSEYESRFPYLFASLTGHKSCTNINNPSENIKARPFDKHTDANQDRRSLNSDTNYDCSPDLSPRRRHPPTQSLNLQQDAHSSKHQIRMEGAENVGRSALPTPKSDFECEKCEKKITNEFLFSIHLQAHEKQFPLKCNQCPIEFQCESSLRDHYVIHLHDKPFKCDLCSYASETKRDLNTHIRHCHGPKLSKDLKQSKKEFRCGKCPRLFRKESTFAAHVRSINCDPNPFKCDQCSRKFDAEYKFKRHYRIHTGEKPFQCDQCPYVSTDKDNLKRHKKTMHEI